MSKMKKIGKYSYDIEKLEEVLSSLSTTGENGSYMDFTLEEDHNGICQDGFNGGYESPPEWFNHSYSWRTKFGREVLENYRGVHCE